MKLTSRMTSRSIENLRAAERVRIEAMDEGWAIRYERGERAGYAHAGGFVAILDTPERAAEIARRYAPGAAISIEGPPPDSATPTP